MTPVPTVPAAPPDIRVRRFARTDRDQLADLVGAHAAVVLPGAAISAQALLSHLEREPSEFIVDPWVVERATLVAEQRGRIVAASHLRRYGSDLTVGAGYRGAAEVAWLVGWPPAPFWPDSAAAIDRTLDAAVAVLDAWGGPKLFDGSLPLPGVVGLADAWPHLAGPVAAAGFHGGRREWTLGIPLAALPDDPPPGVARTLGINGVRFTLTDARGLIEVAVLGGPERFARGTAVADVGNLEADGPDARRQLLAVAGRWLRSAGVSLLLAYADDDADRESLVADGFEVLGGFRRGLTRVDGE